MIQVRPVCGSLDEAMNQVSEFESLERFADHCYNEMKSVIGIDLDKELFTTEPYGYDGRINWDTWIILYDGKPMAYSNGELK